jgi:hypothetical protein
VAENRSVLVALAGFVVMLRYSAKAFSLFSCCATRPRLFLFFFWIDFRLALC